MRWHPTVAVGPPTVLVATGSILVRAMISAIPGPISTLQVEPGDSILDVLELIARVAVDAQVLCVSDDLAFREARPGLGASAFCQHVRLTPALGRLRLLPIVVTVQGTPDQSLRANVERLFYFAPGCFATPISHVVARLLSGRLLSPVFADEEDLRRAIRPFLVETEGARIGAAHDYRNLTGAGRLLHDFGGDVFDARDEVLAAYGRLAEADILLKARRFLSEGTRGGSPEGGPSPLSELRREARSHRVVLVDDECRKGWSLALFAGLFGSQPVDVRESAPGVELYDDRFWCIDSPGAAERFFSVWSDHLQEGSSAWADREAVASADKAAVREASGRRAAVARRLTDAESDVARADALVTATASALAKSAAGLKAIASPALEALAECYTDSSGEPEAIVAQKASIAALYSALGDYERTMVTAERAARDGDRLRSARDRLREEDASAERELAEATTRSKRSEEQLRSALAALSETPSCSVVLLDMRLDPEVDRERSPAETTGARVLAAVKARFPFLPVLMLTASARAQSMAVSSALGADGYWIKCEDTGQQLAHLLRRAFRKSAVHRVWTDLGRVAAKKELKVRCLTGSGTLQVISWPKGQRDRAIVLQFLHRVCELLYEAAGDTTIGRPSTESLLRQAMVDLGFIQEMRFDNNTRIADQAWFKNLPSEEQKWRDRRNRVIHHGEAVSLDDGLNFLRFTVRQLLSD